MAMDLFAKLRNNPSDTVERSLTGDVSLASGIEPMAEKPKTSVLSSLIASMRTNAEVQARTQAKKVASEQTERMLNTKITFNPDGSLDMKGVDPAMLNGTQKDDLDAAYNGPKEAVEEKIAAQTPAPPMPQEPPPSIAEPLYQAADQTYGFRVPRTHEVRELLKTPEGTRKIVAMLGGDERQARGYIKTMGKPGNLDKRAAMAAEKLLAKYSSVYETVGVVDKRATEMGRLETAKRTEDRLIGESKQKEREDIENDASSIDFTLLDKSEWAQALADRTGISVEDASAKYGGLIRGIARQQVEKQRVGKIESFRKDNATLGSFKSWDEAKKSVGVTMKPEEEAMARADYEASRDAYTDKRTDQYLQIMAAQRAEAAARDLAESRNRGAANDEENRKYRNEERQQKKIEEQQSLIQKENETIKALTTKLADPDTTPELKAVYTRQITQARQRALKNREVLDSLIPKSVKKAANEQTQASDVQKYGADIASKLKAAEAAGFTREQAIKRLEEAGIVKPDQISEMSIPEKKQQNPPHFDTQPRSPQRPQYGPPAPKVKPRQPTPRAKPAGATYA
jgi:hypothetical protein